MEGSAPTCGTATRLATSSSLIPRPRSQPDGVHGDSAVIDPEFEWTDPEWIGQVITDYVISEIHVGTFTDAGTFDAAIERLDDLRALGITAIELMPVAQFPGATELGLRRRLPVRRAFQLRGRRRPPPARRRVPRAWHVGGARRRLQPPRPGRQRARSLRPVLHQTATERRGATHSTSTTAAPTKFATTSSRTRLLGLGLHDRRLATRRGPCDR